MIYSITLPSISAIAYSGAFGMLKESGRITAPSLAILSAMGSLLFYFCTSYSATKKRFDRLTKESEEVEERICQKQEAISQLYQQIQSAISVGHEKVEIATKLIDATNKKFPPAEKKIPRQKKKKTMIRNGIEPVEIDRNPKFDLEPSAESPRLPLQPFAHLVSAIAWGTLAMLGFSFALYPLSYSLVSSATTYILSRIDNSITENTHKKIRRIVDDQKATEQELEDKLKLMQSYANEISCHLEKTENIFQSVNAAYTTLLSQPAQY